MVNKLGYQGKAAKKAELAHQEQREFQQKFGVYNQKYRQTLSSYSPPIPPKPPLSPLPREANNLDEAGYLKPLDLENDHEYSNEQYADSGVDDSDYPKEQSARSSIDSVDSGVDFGYTGTRQESVEKSSAPTPPPRNLPRTPPVISTRDADMRTTDARANKNLDEDIYSTISKVNKKPVEKKSSPPSPPPLRPNNTTLNKDSNLRTSAKTLGTPRNFS